MKIGIVSPYLHSKHGGPSTVVRLHARALSTEANVRVYGVADSSEREEVRDAFPEAVVLERSWPTRWYRAPRLPAILSRDVGGLDVVHAHGFWEQPVFAAWRSTRLAGKPLIVTPHGSIAARWRYQGAHKRVYARLISRPMLREAACVHVLTHAEEVACRAFGVPGPIRVIPNGIPSAVYDQPRDPRLALERWPCLRGRRVMLYLGRLWSEKGLDILPAAWARVVQSEPAARDWMLVLAGPDYRGYRQELEEAVRRLGIDQQVLFTGSVGGTLKESLLAAANCFTLPSHGEGFSMAILEGIAAGLPVLYTAECNFPELERAGGGWEVERAGVVELGAALRHVLSQSPEEIWDRGQRARELGRSRYTLESVANALLDLYSTVYR